MKRILIALSAAALVGLAGSAPASAMSFTFSLPSLTFPPQPAPETTQGCSEITSLNADACVTSTK